MKKLIPKNPDAILAFLKAYRRARMNMFVIPLALTLGLSVFLNSTVYKGMPYADQSSVLHLAIGLAAVWFFLQGLFSFLGGKARCPQCKTPPLVFRKLLGVGPVIGFGIPIFARQIKRCHKCDYPLSLTELEKDLAAERQALEQSEVQPESKA